jgi:hypothetical protein
MLKTWLCRILVVVAGLVIGGLVNGALIMVSGKVIAPPPGADVTTAEGLKASLHLFEPRHFVFPFLAHALGTFAGALAAAWWTPGRTPGPAYTVGGLFLLAGIANVVMLPAPLWFSALDLIVAYLPMAWLAHRLVSRG